MLYSACLPVDFYNGMHDSHTLYCRRLQLCWLSEENHSGQVKISEEKFVPISLLVLLLLIWQLKHHKMSVFNFSYLVTPLFASHLLSNPVSFLVSWWFVWRRCSWNYGQICLCKVSALALWEENLRICALFQCFLYFSVWSVAIPQTSIFSGLFLSCGATGKRTASSEHPFWTTRQRGWFVMLHLHLLMLLLLLLLLCWTEIIAALQYETYSQTCYVYFCLSSSSLSSTVTIYGERLNI